MAASQHRKLQNGRSLWQAKRLPGLAIDVLRRDLSCDVLVIGAGISGAFIAEHLTDAGMQVVLIDRRGPVAGSTSASTALLQAELDLPLHHLAKRIGRMRAERMWRRSKLALSALGERLHRLGLGPEVARRDAIYLQGDVLDASGLQVEAEWRRRAGFEACYLSSGDVRRRFGIEGRAALLTHGGMESDPRRLAAGFLRVALQRGARLFAPVDAIAVSPHGRGVSVQTRHGPVIRASHVVFATGYEMPKGVPQKGHRIVSTWALATRPQPRRLWPEHVMITEASDPYLYLRVGPDGCVICGGEDEEGIDQATRIAITPRKIERLEAKLGRLFPQLRPDAAFAWGGSFGASPTGSPSIGPVPRMPNCYAVLGYGGNGTTFSMLAAQLVTAALTGRDDLDADLFSFQRAF